MIKDGRGFPTPAKVDTISNWKFPTTMKEWYQFIGFVNFLSSFIPNCALLLKPLYEHHTCLKSKKESSVDEAVLKTKFEELKTKIKESTGLQLFDPNETVFIYTHASELGAGGVLLQEWKEDKKKLTPIAFY